MHNDITSHHFNINLRLARVNNIWKIIVQQLDLLQSMTPVEFLAFRNYITPASGFQSHQFRVIEAKLGLTDSFRSSYRSDYFTKKMFKNEQSRQLIEAMRETSLLTYLERWLESVYATAPFDFLEEYQNAVGRFVDHGKDQKIAVSFLSLFSNLSTSIVHPIEWRFRRNS